MVVLASVAVRKFMQALNSSFEVKLLFFISWSNTVPFVHC